MPWRPPISRFTHSAAAVSFESLAAFDAARFVVPRPRFSSCGLSQEDAQSLVVCNEEEVLAFGTLRQCRTGWKVGPLFGTDAGVAEELLLALAHHAGPASDIFLDVPEINPAASGLARRFGMEPMFETLSRLHRINVERWSRQTIPSVGP